MLAIKGIYDGKRVKLLERPPKNGRCKVIITFLEELDEAKEIRDFSAQATSFTFWNNPKEDIYQDYLTKSKR